MDETRAEEADGRPLHQPPAAIESDCPAAERSAGECSTCFKPIDPRARKCTECDSYQDWRRHLQIGSSVLALFVALISVIALATPMLAPFLTSKDSNIVVSLEGFHGGKAYLMATNSGNRAGTVSAISLLIRGERKGEVSETELGALELEPTIVRPGDSRQLMAPVSGFALDMAEIALYDELMLKGRWDLRVKVTYRNFASDRPTEANMRSILIDFLDGSTRSRWFSCVRPRVRTPGWGRRRWMPTVVQECGKPARERTGSDSFRSTESQRKTN
jgi:hypothetical protein